MKRTLQDLTIKDPFMFAAVMSDENQCKSLLSLVLEMEILHVTVVTEKTLAYHPEYHGVRLDVFAVEDGTRRRFNVELQVKDNKNLPRRSRYYHAQLDMDALVTGIDYNELPDTYVIFICDYDPMDSLFYRYTIANQCQENKEKIADGIHTIWLNTKGQNKDDVPKELVDFLEYVESPNETKDLDEEDSFIKSLKEQIAAIKRNREWEGRFMLFEEMLSDERKEARAEGLAEGEQATLQKMNRLVQLLSEQNRMADMIKAANDSAFQKELFKEFHL